MHGEFKMLQNHDIKQGIEQYTNDLHLLLDFANDKIITSIPMTKLSRAEEDLVECYSRLIVWVEVLLNLKDDRIYCDMVMSGARTIFELYLDIHILKDKNDEHVKKIDAFAKTCSFRTAQKVVNIAKTDKIPFDDLLNYFQSLSTDVSLKKQTEDIAIKHWGYNKSNKIIWPDHWTGQKPLERARNLGPEFVKMYAIIFGSTSWCVHANPLPVSDGDYFNILCAFGYGYITKMFAESSRLCIEHICVSEKDSLLKEFDSQCGHIKAHISF
jgi:hypothetical protein